MNLDMRKFLSIVENVRVDELTVDLHRQMKTGGGNRRPRSRDRGEGEGPKGGKYWFRNTSLISITGKVNEIVSQAGQYVLLNPETFGFTSLEILDYLQKFGDDKYSAYKEYLRLLSGTEHDITKVALLSKSSKAITELMFKQGWVLIHYDTESDCIKFAVSPDAAKRQVGAAAELFPMLQIGETSVTLVTKFTGIEDYLTQSDNRTFKFSREELPGFAGIFGGLSKWISSGEAPESNWVYFSVPKDRFDTFYHLDNLGNATKMRVTMGDKTSKTVWGMWLFAKPFPQKDEMVLARIAKQAGMNVSRANAKGLVRVYSDKFFNLQSRFVEVWDDNKWITWEEAIKKFTRR